MPRPIRFIFHLIAAASLLLSLATLALWVRSHRVARRLRAAHRDKRCPNCRYDLRASPSGCPECGLRIAVESPPPTTPIPHPLWRAAISLAVAGTLLSAVGFFIDRAVQHWLASRHWEWVQQAAIRSRNWNTIEKVLSQGSMNQELANSALSEAVFADRPQSIKLLLNAGADIRAEPGCLPLALYLEQYAMARVLLEHGADPNAVGDIPYQPPPLHQLIETRRADLLDLTESLLAHGADPNQRDLHGNAPLHTLATDFSANPNDVPFARLLIKYNASLSQTDARGNTPLDLAQITENAPLKDFFIQLHAPGKSLPRLRTLNSELSLSPPHLSPPPECLTKRSRYATSSPNTASSAFFRLNVFTSVDPFLVFVAAPSFSSTRIASRPSPRCTDFATAVTAASASPSNRPRAAAIASGCHA